MNKGGGRQRSGSEDDAGADNLTAPADWYIPESPKFRGYYLVRNYRRLKPSVVYSIMAMYTELGLRGYHRTGTGTSSRTAMRGVFAWLKWLWRGMKDRYPAAREAFGRALAGQVIDLVRLWNVNCLSPAEYYDGRLARYHGSADITRYLGYNVIARIIVQLQRDTFGNPPFPIFDKAAFGIWCRANGVRSPREIALGPQSGPPSLESLAALGDNLFIKLRGGAGGEMAEAWERKADGLWHGAGHALTPTQFTDRLAGRCGAEDYGILVQERLRNHDRLAATCGTALSTCRVVTIVNEAGEPEVVQSFWRMATHEGTVVDNFHSGGIMWIARDPRSGEIGHGYSHDSQDRMQVLTDHPVTGEHMQGNRHPFWAEIRDAALEAHGRLDNVIVAGWDVAMTPDGVVIVEMNFPPGLTCRTQMVWDGIENARLGEILAWRARDWIGTNVDAASRRRIAADWKATE